jgi:hypothetical protein
VNCESKGVGHSYGSMHTELVITLTDSDGEPVNSNQEELNSDYMEAKLVICGCTRMGNGWLGFLPLKML